MCPISASGSNQPQEANLTVGQVLDARILRARQTLEALCIQKAKAETAGLLSCPQSLISDLAW
jgi:hypothetical protein